MRIDELQDALRGAADRQPPTTRNLDAVRAGARRRQRARARLLATTTVLVLVAGAAAGAMLVAGDSSGNDDVRTAASTDPTAGGGDTAGSMTVLTGAWEKLPTPPIALRTRFVGVWTGGEVIVVGGELSSCPPTADCVGSPEPLADGAILDLSAATPTWRPMAPSPVPFAHASTAVLDGIAYFLAFLRTPDGQTEAAMLAYDIAADTWRELPTPPGAPTLSYLVATDAAIVAYAGSDERGEVPDQLYVPATDTWSPLQDDPLSPSFDRVMLWSAPHLYLLDHELVPNPGSAEPSIVRLARLDPGTPLNEWERLADSEILGGVGPEAWYVDDSRLINPSLGSADGGEVNGWGRDVPFGGVYGISSGHWAPLPPAPAPDGGPGRSTGVVTATGGAITSDGPGLLLDLNAVVWVEMPAPPDGSPGGQPRMSITVPAGRDAVAFGYVWSEDTNDDLLEHGWLWRSD